MPQEYMVDGLANHLDGLLGRVRSTLTPVGADDGPPPSGRGEAADGRVTVTVVRGGYLGDLRIDPQWLRAQDAAAVQEAVKRAVAAAVDDLHAQRRAAAPGPGDLDEVLRLLDRTLDGVATDVARAAGRWQDR